jgi:hypothetical protein
MDRMVIVAKQEGCVLRARADGMADHAHRFQKVAINPITIHRQILEATRRYDAFSREPPLRFECVVEAQDTQMLTELANLLLNTVNPQLQPGGARGRRPSPSPSPDRGRVRGRGRGLGLGQEREREREREREQEQEQEQEPDTLLNSLMLDNFSVCVGMSDEDGEYIMRLTAASSVDVSTLQRLVASFHVVMGGGQHFAPVRHITVCAGPASSGPWIIGVTVRSTCNWLPTTAARAGTTPHDSALATAAPTLPFGRDVVLGAALSLQSACDGEHVFTIVDEAEVALSRLAHQPDRKISSICYTLCARGTTLPLMVHDLLAISPMATLFHSHTITRSDGGEAVACPLAAIRFRYKVPSVLVSHARGRGRSRSPVKFVAAAATGDDFADQRRQRSRSRERD